MNVLSIIIPARNESDNIITTVTDLVRTLDSHSLRYEILIIDDGSVDNTYILSSSLCADLGPHIRVFRNVGLNGFGRAICHGLSNITGDYVIIYMADASDSPDDVIRYYNYLLAGFDCVFGSRFMVGSIVTRYPFFKLLINRVVNIVIATLFRLDYYDITNAFKAYSKHVIIGCAPLVSPHFNLTVELPLKAIVRGYSYTVIPISWTNRRHGVSSLKLHEMGSRYLYSILICYFEFLLVRNDYRRIIK